MSEQVLEQNEKKVLYATPVRRVQPKTGMIGIPEIVGLILSGLLIFLATLSYFYFLMPANARLKRAKDEKITLDKSIENLKKSVNDKESTAIQIAARQNSIINFERNALRQQKLGQMSLYEELNQAIHRNALRNTDGPTYTALDPLDPNAPKTQANKGGIARFQSLFPGVSVSVTVEGSYINLRRFIRDVEASGQFVIINAVQLEGQEKSGNETASNPDDRMDNPNAPSQKKSSVSLRLDMAVYFQREASAGEQ